MLGPYSKMRLGGHYASTFQKIGYNGVVHLNLGLWGPFDMKNVDL